MPWRRKKILGSLKKVNWVRLFFELVQSTSHNVLYMYLFSLSFLSLCSLAPPCGSVPPGLYCRYSCIRGWDCTSYFRLGWLTEMGVVWLLVSKFQCPLCPDLSWSPALIMYVAPSPRALFCDFVWIQTFACWWYDLISVCSNSPHNS